MVTPEEKRRALEEILGSQTFHRCDQLKRILSYVCAKDLDGRPDDITEYLIGVEALGRGRDFSPSDDSSVRSRAHALRKKLQEYYLVESPRAELRIDLPKASYCPQYVRVSPAAGEPAPARNGIAERGRRFPVAWLAFAAGVLLTAAAGYLARKPLAVGIHRATIPAIVKTAWGPLLEGEVLVVVATPSQLFLRDFGDVPHPRDPAWMPEIAQTPELLSFYGKRHPVSPQSKLLFHPNLSSPLWGDAAAAMSAVATLAGYGVSCRVLPERLMTPYTLRDRNVLLFGRPEYSPAARLLMDQVPFTIEYNPQVRSVVVRNRAPKAGERQLYEPREGASGEVEIYGLLTVLPGETPQNRRKRMVIFSGLTTAGAQAATEFFSTPEMLAEMDERFRQEGLKDWPRAWQALVRTTGADPTLPMSFRYEAHRVLQK